jgi:NhaA family Na+:H+ antiporter
MATFFFVVGLEMKRELITGQLASPRRALLPIAAAIGGMLFPAACYLFFNLGKPGAAGWGVPMATDIAFALGVLALVGKRVPPGLKVFVAALAIVDDIGAVVVIALFYSSQLHVLHIAIALGYVVVLLIANKLGLRNPFIYAFVGVAGVWHCFLLSGIHPTIAGILLALTVPAKPRLSAREFAIRAQRALALFERQDVPVGGVTEAAEHASALSKLKAAHDELTTPLQRVETALRPWVVFLVVPLFALSNAGVPLNWNLSVLLSNSVSLGIGMGLVLGKPLGISLFTWLSLRFRLASLPAGVTWRHLYGASWLGGIGFTMSLFISSLAFQGTPLLPAAKSAVLFSSLVAGSIGWAILRVGGEVGSGAQGKSVENPHSAD